MTLPSVFTRENRLSWAGICILALLQAVLLVAGVTGTRLAFSSLDDGQLSMVALGMIFGAALGLAVLRPLLRLIAEAVGQGNSTAVRKVLLAHAMGSTPGQIAARRSGYLMLRLTGDMTAMKDGIARSLPPLVQAAALIPASLLALCLIDLRFGAGALAVTGIFLGVAALSVPPLLQSHEALRAERGKLAADMAERLPIAPDLARLGRRERELSNLDRAARSLQTKAQTRLIRVEILRALPGVMFGLCAVAILWDGSRRGLAAGELAASLAALGIMAHIFVEMTTALDRLAGWRVARDNLARAVSSGGGKSKSSAAKRTRLAAAHPVLSVSAPPEAMVPDHVHLKPGERAVLRSVNPSHLVRVISGQEADPGFEVTLDGTPIGALTQGSIRRTIGILDPSPVVLKGSVRRNVSLGLAERPSDATVLKRIDKAGLRPALDSLGGLDGHVGEGGRTFTLPDRLKLSALQAAVQRPAVLVVAVEKRKLPEAVAAFVDDTGSSVVIIDV
jgi:ATP-binding cassette, subfamily B, bacterial